MTDYQKMYIKLFNKITNVIEELQEIQRQTEQLYMDNKDSEIILLEPLINEKEAHATK